MKQNYTAVVKQDGQWWIGWVEEVPGVNCQERTRKRLLESLRTTLSELRYEASRSAATPYRQRLFTSSRRRKSFVVAQPDKRE